MKLSVSVIVVFAFVVSAAAPRQTPWSVAEQVELFSAPTAAAIPDNYIVVLKPDANIADHHSFLTSALAEDAAFQTVEGESTNELKHIYEMPTFRGYAGRFSPDVLDLIRERADVAYVERDQVVHAIELQRNAPWGLSRVSHREPLTFRNFNRYVYDNHGGEDVVTYVVDTGINIHHVDFEGRAKWGVTVPDGDADEDGNGHGSHVAGTMVGARYGVAKKATVVAVKVLRSNGSGSMSDVVRGVEWVAQSHEQAMKEAAVGKGDGRKGSVANMSLGGGMSKALNAAVNAAVEAGVHFAVAAGNDDANACDYSPASAELAVTVGASTIEDERAWFSNKGTCVDVFAPGKDITSVWNSGKTSTNTISGTSMASPHVAGLLAYLLSLEKESIGTKALKRKLIKLATPDVLSKVPSDTPNLLIFSDPPAEAREDQDVVKTQDEVETLVQARVNAVLEALKTVFGQAGVTTADDDTVELEWSWI